MICAGPSEFYSTPEIIETEGGTFGDTPPHRAVAGDSNFVLSVLHRELASWMFQRDPERYRRAYEAALLFVACDMTAL